MLQVVLKKHGKGEFIMDATAWAVYPASPAMPAFLGIDSYGAFLSHGNDIEGTNFRTGTALGAMATVKTSVCLSYRFFLGITFVHFLKTLQRLWRTETPHFNLFLFLIVIRIQDFIISNDML